MRDSEAMKTTASLRMRPCRGHRAGFACLLFLVPGILFCPSAIAQKLGFEKPKLGEITPSWEASNPGSQKALGSYPQPYRALLVQAMENFQARKFREALACVDKADGLMPATTWSLNIRGAVAIEQRNFADGKRYCAEALRLDANFFPAEFNLGEIPFLEGKYAEAREAWGRIIARAKKDGATVELLTYRVFLAYLLEKDFDQAKEWLEKIPFPSKTPAYDYAHAAWELQQGNEKKWEEWLRSARSTWSEAKRASFTDVLIQIGWLKPG